MAPVADLIVYAPAEPQAVLPGADQGVRSTLAWERNPFRLQLNRSEAEPTSFPGHYPGKKKPELLMLRLTFVFDLFRKALIKVFLRFGTWPFAALFFRETNPITLGQRLYSLRLLSMSGERIHRVQCQLQ